MGLFKKMKRRHVIVVMAAMLVLLLTACATNSDIQRDPLHIDETYPPAMIELNFDSHGDRLNGILYQAGGTGPHPTVVLLHGYPGNEKNLDLAHAMRRAGYNVLFFHYRGAWGSGGDFSFTHVIEDVGSAIQYLRQSADDIRVDSNKILLVGHSMGGFAALQGAARDEAIKCVAGIAPADLGLAADLILANPEMGKGFAAGADGLTMLNGWSGDIVLDELENSRDKFSLIDLAPKLNGKKVLLIAGDKDITVPPDVFHAPLVIVYETQPNIELTQSIISGDHAFSWSRFQLINTVLDWAVNCEAPS